MAFSEESLVFFKPQKADLQKESDSGVWTFLKATLDFFERARNRAFEHIGFVVPYIFPNCFVTIRDLA